MSLCLGQLLEAVVGAYARPPSAEAEALLDRAGFSPLCTRLGLSEDDFCDRAASALAAGFDADVLDFVFCDVVINDIVGWREYEVPSLCWEVYLAFDAGEFHRRSDHGDDPVVEHTRPLIAQAMIRWEIAPWTGPPPSPAPSYF